MFEASVDAPPSTPSARRVRLDSSPVSSSPLRFLSTILSSSAESRAHPDPKKDVWEISVWDPVPLCLNMFCLFSPGHVVVYWLFLPTSPQDVRPSTTIVTTIALAALLSFQLRFLQSNFSQQSKDASLIHKEVLNEYDIKYVHPRTQPVMRDVGIQCSKRTSTENITEVDTYRSITIVNKGFRTNPNPNYSKYFDPDAQAPSETPQRVTSWDISQQTTPSFRAPIPARDLTSPIRQQSVSRQAQFRSSVSQSTGDGGSLGIYTHDRSPLKKAASHNLLNQRYSSRY
jgi:hypothetical protein